MKNCCGAGRHICCAISKQVQVDLTRGTYAKLQLKIWLKFQYEMIRIKYFLQRDRGMGSKLGNPHILIDIFDCYSVLTARTTNIITHACKVIYTGKLHFDAIIYNVSILHAHTRKILEVGGILNMSFTLKYCLHPGKRPKHMYKNICFFKKNKKYPYKEALGLEYESLPLFVIDFLQYQGSHRVSVIFCMDRFSMFHLPLCLLI